MVHSQEESGCGSPASGTDASGHKRFQCARCPYRSNWRADVLRHVRKRHPQLADAAADDPHTALTRTLAADEAALSLAAYERTHGAQVRKRARQSGDLLDASGGMTALANANSDSDFDSQGKPVIISYYES